MSVPVLSDAQKLIAQLFLARVVITEEELSKSVQKIVDSVGTENGLSIFVFIHSELLDKSTPLPETIQFISNALNTGVKFKIVHIFSEVYLFFFFFYFLFLLLLSLFYCRCCILFFVATIIVITAIVTTINDNVTVIVTVIYLSVIAFLCVKVIHFLNNSEFIFIKCINMYVGSTIFT